MSEKSPSGRSTRNAMQGSGDVIDYLTYPTLVGHIHLNKELITNFFMKVIIVMGFILLV
jgi:hypothetical protein